MTDRAEDVTLRRAVLIIIGLRTAWQWLLLFGVLAAPLLTMRALSEPFRDWIDYSSGPFGWAGTVALAATLFCSVVDFTVTAALRSPRRRWHRQAAFQLQWGAILLALGFGSVCLAAAVAHAHLGIERMEILAGVPNREAGRGVFRAAAICGLVGAGVSLLLHFRLQPAALRHDVAAARDCEVCGYSVEGLSRCPECGCSVGRLPPQHTGVPGGSAEQRSEL